MGNADPRIGWALDRAARERAEEPGTIDLGTGERRTWTEVKRRVDGVASGGENIYTTEVENAIYSHASVLEAAAFAIPHEEWGEAVHAEVVLKPDESVEPDEIIEHCRASIAGYKVPRSVNVRTADEPLPKSGAGKILKRDLREPFWEGRERRVG